MKKLGMILGVAAVAVVAGCKDADYNYKRADSQNEVKPVADAPAPAVWADSEPKAESPKVEERRDEKPKAEDVKVERLPEAPAPAEPEYTVYVVQRGDYLAKISRKYNVTISSIKRLNNLKGDTIRLGQKLKLPGRIDVGAQTVPEGARAKPAAKADRSVYVGETREYVVKSGDTLGAIAYGNGINIRQLKALNNLTTDVVRVGQKLKVPASGKAAEKKAETKPAEKKAAVPAVEAGAAESAPSPEDVPAPSVADPVPDAGTAAPAAAASSEQQAPATYVVQEGEDLTAVTLRWGVTKAAICELNNLSEDAQLTPGQILKLPADAQL